MTEEKVSRNVLKSPLQVITFIITILSHMANRMAVFDGNTHLYYPHQNSLHCQHQHESYLTSLLEELIAFP